MSQKRCFTRLLSTYNIKREIINKLSSNGFTLKSEIEALNDSELQSICRLSDEEIDEINEIIRNSHKTRVQLMPVFDMFSTQIESISSGCDSMDNALNGGLEVSQLTQISGEAGVGKTQIGHQLLINVQMPANVGLSAEGLYIDTEKSFRPERIQSMALNALKRYKDLNPNVSVDYLKSRVHLKECFDDAKQLLQMIDQQIEPFIEMNPKIRLIVIDSIAQHFRYDYKGKDYEKDYELAQIAYKLKHLALSKKIAVLVLNQVTHNPDLNCDIPSLGNQWQTVCSTSLMIERLSDDNMTVSRRGHLIKSPHFPETKRFYFRVTENGIENDERVLLWF